MTGKPLQETNEDKSVKDVGVRTNAESLEINTEDEKLENENSADDEVKAKPSPKKTKKKNQKNLIVVNEANVVKSEENETQVVSTNKPTKKKKKELTDVKVID